MFFSIIQIIYESVQVSQDRSSWKISFQFDSEPLIQLSENRVSSVVQVMYPFLMIMSARKAFLQAKCLSLLLF